MRPIWESASRPLFVRSVWQETIGRRHFILDYEPRQRQRWKRQKTRSRGKHFTPLQKHTFLIGFFRK